MRRYYLNYLTQPLYLTIFYFLIAQFLLHVKIILYSLFPALYKSVLFHVTMTFINF